MFLVKAPLKSLEALIILKVSFDKGLGQKCFYPVNLIKLALEGFFSQTEREAAYIVSGKMYPPESRAMLDIAR